MFRHVRHTLIVALSFTLLTLVVIAPGISSAAPTEAPQAAALSPDFSFWLSYDTANWFDPSYLARGGRGPLYELCVYGCFWSENALQIGSRNGFTGNVTIEVLNLPPGITAELPSFLFVPKFRSVRTSVYFRATTTAALGNVSGVILRGRSGNIVHTIELPTFTVVDQLPPLH